MFEATRRARRCPDRGPGRRPSTRMTPRSELLKGASTPTHKHRPFSSSCPLSQALRCWVSSVADGRAAGFHPRLRRRANKTAPLTAAWNSVDLFRRLAPAPEPLLPISAAYRDPATRTVSRRLGPSAPPRLHADDAAGRTNGCPGVRARLGGWPLVRL